MGDSDLNLAPISPPPPSALRPPPSIPPPSCPAVSIKFSPISATVHAGKRWSWIDNATCDHQRKSGERLWSKSQRAGCSLVDGAPLDHPAGLLLLLHKPIGLVWLLSTNAKARMCTACCRSAGGGTITQVTSIGRLDKDTSGLILLTDQSELVHRLTSPKHKVPKVYRATLSRDLSPDLIALFRQRSFDSWPTKKRHARRRN